jgi:hypothetical protein
MSNFFLRPNSPPAIPNFSERLLLMVAIAFFLLQVSDLFLPGIFVVKLLGLNYLVVTAVILITLVCVAYDVSPDDGILRRHRIAVALIFLTYAGLLVHVSDLFGSYERDYEAQFLILAAFSMLAESPKLTHDKTKCDKLTCRFGRYVWCLHRIFQ